MHNYYNLLVISSRLKKNKENNLLDKINTFKNVKIDGLFILKIYPKTISIEANLKISTIPNTYFIDPLDNKLYQVIGPIAHLVVNGNYFIALSDSDKYINKAWTITNGNMVLLHTYFDGTNNKLINYSNEIVTNGIIIITDDFNIYIRIKNIWISH